jgi:hypothetical protein
MTRMSPEPARLPLRLRPLVVLAGGLVALGTAACAEPALPDVAQGEGADRPVEAQAPDPAREALVAQLGDLRTTVAAARDDLAVALEPADAASARRAGGAAVAALLEGEGDADAPSLFPSTTTERGDLGTEDVLTTTLTAARDAGGSLGRSALELLRDPVAGDLGTWQRDPSGVVATVRSTVASSRTLETLERAVLELPGEGTRALAWALLTADARDTSSAAAFAERGLAHLDIILVALDDLLDRAEGADGADGEDGADGAEGADGADGADEDEPTEEEA